MMERALDLIRDCARLAWWDGSCVDLRLSRLAALIDGLAEAWPSRPATASRR